MPRYRYECSLSAFGEIEAPDESRADEMAYDETVRRVLDADVTVTYDTTLTELSEGDTQR